MPDVVTNAVADDDLVRGVRELMDEVVLLCIDVDNDLGEEILELSDGLSEEEARRVFTHVLVVLRSGFDEDLTDERRLALIDQVRDIVDELVHFPRDGSSHEPDGLPEPIVAPQPAATADGRVHLELLEANGLLVRDVSPTPTFLGQPVVMREGHVRVADLNLWDYNHRLELHVHEFVTANGRRPDKDEVLDIMLGRLSLPGAGGKRDQFKILELANSIAMKGVERPPVIDWWGTPWDGNRRIAACHLILHSSDSEFGPDAKARASSIRVWQTPEGATRDQIDSIVIALNFDQDFKLAWPEYVKAKQVYDDYVARYDQASAHATVEPQLDRLIRRQVGQKFGIRTQNVTRYVKMVVWAQEFEEYHANQNDREPTEIAHRANRLFQYFYELDSGRGEDKLAVKLHADPAFKALVFDLMYDGKFKNWAQVRDLKKVVSLPSALNMLREAHAQTHLPTAQQLIEDAVLEARRADRTLRQVGIGDRLLQMAEWFEEDATLTALRAIDHDTLRRFRDAVQPHLGTMAAALGEVGPTTEGDE